MKKKKPSNLFNYMSLQAQIREAGNMIRWNIPLALEWMDYTALRVSTTATSLLWNNTAKYINNYLIMLEKYKFYDKKEYWGENTKPRLLEEMPLVINYSEYLEQV